MSLQSQKHSEIHDRVQRGYIERLQLRVKKMRKLLVERSWNELRLECAHLKNTAAGFGLPDIAEMAGAIESTIPASGVGPATTLPETRKAAEILFITIDSLHLNRRSINQ